MRKQRQEFQFDWGAARLSPAPEPKPAERKAVIVVACGICGACKSGMHDLCEKLVDDLMR